MLSHSSRPFLEALTTAMAPSRLSVTAAERIRPEPGLAPSGSAQCRPLLPRPACKPARDRHAHRDLQPTEHRIVLSRPGGPGTRIGCPVSAARPPQVPPAHRSHARSTRYPMHTTRDRATEVHHASSDIGDAKNERGHSWTWHLHQQLPMPTDGKPGPRTHGVISHRYPGVVGVATGPRGRHVSVGSTPRAAYSDRGVSR